MVGGRKTAYDEKQDATWFRSAWEEEHDVAALQAKVSSGDFAARDRFLLEALQGEPRGALMKLADKMIPDMIDFPSTKPLIVILPARRDAREI